MTDLTTRRGLPGLAFPEDALKRAAGDLATRFEGIFGPETIERYVLESYTALLRTAQVRAHLTTNATRFAIDRLTALGQATGAIERTVPEVLFVCEQNAGRSQMAAVFTNVLSGDACPIYPSKTYRDWHLTDPAGLPLEQVRLIRDDVRKLVESLLTELGIEPKGLPA